MTLEDLARELPRLQAEAKALWGEKQSKLGADLQGIDDWEWHLQQMVISENPMEYLEETL